MVVLTGLGLAAAMAGDGAPGIPSPGAGEARVGCAWPEADRSAGHWLTGAICRLGCAGDWAMSCGSRPRLGVVEVVASAAPG